MSIVVKQAGFCWILCWVVSMLLLPISSHADNLGILGKTFSIHEPDMIKVMQVRLFYLEKMGYLKKVKKALRDQAKHYAIRPTPVAGITTTVENRAWYYDPSITMPQNSVAPNGSLLIKAGSKYNPLQHVHLDETLLFYNADDDAQIKFAEKKEQTQKGLIKFILVKGSVPAQVKQFHQPIYFDQWGELTRRFHIQHVPAIVFQEGLRLKIMELVP